MHFKTSQRYVTIGLCLILDLVRYYDLGVRSSYGDIRSRGVLILGWTARA